MRDWHGKLLHGFYCHLGFGTSLRAELWGVLKGVNLAKSLSLGRLVVEMDSKVAHDLITIRCPEDHPCADLVKNIVELANLNWEIYFNLIYREANRCADALAGLGQNSNDVYFDSSNIPHFLQPLLRDDVAGVAFPRLV